MTQLPYQFAAPVPPIPRDRRTALIVFGIFALVIGGLSACSAIATPLMLVMAGALSQAPGTNVHVYDVGFDTRSIGSTIVLYAVVAGAFIAGGIGSIRTRRWARPLMLSVGWTWLLVGVFGMIMMAALAPSMQEAMSAGAGGPAPPPGFARTVVWIMLGVSTLLYVVLPAVFIVFYSSPHVRATLEHYDPVPGWSDRAPVSVFTLSVALAVTALFTLSMIPYDLFPLFGTMLRGPAALGGNLAAAGIFLLAAYLVFRLRMSGWWLTMAISIVLPMAMLVTLRKVGTIALYEQMRLPPEQLEPIRNNAMIHGPLIPVATALLGVAGVVYLLAVRKFFVTSAGSGARGTVDSVI